MCDIWNGMDMNVKRRAALVIPELEQYQLHLGLEAAWAELAPSFPHPSPYTRLSRPLLCIAHQKTSHPRLSFARVLFLLILASLGLG